MTADEIKRALAVVSPVRFGEASLEELEKWLNDQLDQSPLPLAAGQAVFEIVCGRCKAIIDRLAVNVEPGKVFRVEGPRIRCRGCAEYGEGT